MLGCWILAIRYITFYWARTCILVAALTVCLCLPLATRWIVERFEQEATARASATPIVVGAKGSQFGLVMHALYFRGDAPDAIPQSQLSRLLKNKDVSAIPIHARYQAQGYAIVGSNDDYLRLRKLQLASGQTMQRLGDCLLGAKVAKELGLKPDQRIVSQPDNMFDLSGPAPLSLRIRGILQPTGTADDDVIHCHIKTCWVIAGLGHGHGIKQVSADESPARQLESDGPSEHRHTASRENMPQYSEVTDENISTFHFHGSEDEYPLTAIIALPASQRAETLLLGKYLDPDEKVQALRPVDVVAEILRMVAQVRRLIDGLALILSLAAGLLVILVLWLSLKLRQKEMQTLVLLGASRTTVISVVCLELAIVSALSCGLALLLASGIAYSSNWIIYWLLV